MSCRAKLILNLALQSISVIDNGRIEQDSTTDIDNRNNLETEELTVSTIDSPIDKNQVFQEESSEPVATRYPSSTLEHNLNNGVKTIIPKSEMEMSMFTRLSNKNTHRIYKILHRLKYFLSSSLEHDFYHNLEIQYFLNYLYTKYILKYVVQLYLLYTDIGEETDSAESSSNLFGDSSSEKYVPEYSDSEDDGIAEEKNDHKTEKRKVKAKIMEAESANKVVDFQSDDKLVEEQNGIDGGRQHSGTSDEDKKKY